MSRPAGWWGPALDGDGRDLRAMLSAFVAAHPTELADDEATVSALVTELAELGIWTIGTAETTGGGGADRGLTVAALEQLGRAWPALGWASVQAHAAVDALSGAAPHPDLIGQIHSGTTAVAVVDAESAHVHLGWSAGTLAGAVDRVDAASPTPHLLVLDGDDTAVLVAPESITFTPVRRTGLGGALTRAAEVNVSAADVRVLTGVDVAAVRARLHVGAAAVAAGIAGAAADAAAEYAGGRRQFGDALTAIPTVRQSLLGQAADASVTVAAALTADDPVTAFAAARRACDDAIEVAASALQSHGGYGYLAEYDAERRLRDAVSLRAAVDTRSAAVTTARALVGLSSGSAALGKDAS